MPAIRSNLGRARKQPSVHVDNVVALHSIFKNIGKASGARLQLLGFNMTWSPSTLLRHVSFVIPAWSLLLSGCDQVKTSQARSQATTSVGSREAGSCPISSRGKHHLRSLRNVWVLDFDGTKMFVPKGWLSGYLDDGRSKSDDAFRSIVSDAIKPSLNSGECPGTVHYFQVGERASRHGAIAFSVQGPLPLKPDKQKLLQGTVVQVFVGVRRRENIGEPVWPKEDVSEDGREGWTRSRRFPRYKLNGRSGASSYGCTAEHDNVDSTWLLYRSVTPSIGIGLVVQSRAEEPSPDWELLCAQAGLFYAWVTTEPARRVTSFDFEAIGQ